MQQPEDKQTAPTPDNPLDQAAKAIDQADKTIRQDPKRWEAAVADLDNAIQTLAAAETNDPARQAQLMGWALMGKGNILVNTNVRANVDAAIDSYQKALASLESVPERNDAMQADIAALLGNIGHARFRLGEAKQLRESETHYRRAIEILAGLPWKNTPRFRHHLAATWLNLGNTLARLDKPTEPTDATIEAFDKALEYTHELAAEDQNFSLLRANARSSLGRTLQWSSAKEHLERAIRELEQAILILEKLPFKEDARIAMELAAAHANRANILSRITPSKESIQATLKSGEVSLQIAGPSEQNNLYAAEIALNARRAICHTFGMIIGSQEANAKQEIQDKATDLIEDGLKIVSLWEQRQATGLRPAAQHLFHLGCAFYSTEQPQFLSEFVSEYLKPEDKVMRESATSAVDRSVARLKSQAEPDPAIIEPLEQKLAELQTAN